MKNKKLTECSECGFPLEWERNPVIIKNDIFSLMDAEDNICSKCKHQADGWTIKKLQGLIRKYYELGVKKGKESK